MADPDTNYYSINAGEGDIRDDWEIAASGTVVHVDNIFATQRTVPESYDPEAEFLLEKKLHEEKKLGQFRGTAIAGNDITCNLSQ